MNPALIQRCFYAARNSRCGMPAKHLAEGLARVSITLDARLAARRAFTSAQKYAIIGETEGDENASIDNES